MIRLRNERGWKQDELADAAQMARGSVSKVEGGESNITLDTLERIAAAFEVSCAQLLSED
ncbi:helix-turn-helix domain-containing protein [Vitreimonas flagellata]|uniref:helix-turn-helix domain-containing protein n=1 Tax=Vitreimonas flagellata TaxID=2560861 RepID=UPI001430674F